MYSCSINTRWNLITILIKVGSWCTNSAPVVGYICARVCVNMHIEALLNCNINPKMNFLISTCIIESKEYSFQLLNSHWLSPCFAVYWPSYIYHNLVEGMQHYRVSNFSTYAKTGLFTHTHTHIRTHFSLPLSLSPHPSVLYVTAWRIPQVIQNKKLCIPFAIHGNVNQMLNFEVASGPSSGINVKIPICFLRWH